jgi:hypothetical protein
VSTTIATRPRLVAAVPQFSVPDVLTTAQYYRDRLGVSVGDVREVVVEDLNGLVLAFGESMTSRP